MCTVSAATPHAHGASRTWRLVRIEAEERLVGGRVLRGHVTVVPHVEQVVVAAGRELRPPRRPLEATHLLRVRARMRVRAGSRVRARSRIWVRARIGIRAKGDRWPHTSWATPPKVKGKVKVKGGHTPPRRAP